MRDFWDESAALKDLLFDTNMSLIDIAKYFEISQAELSKRIKDLGLDWVRRKPRKMSRGQAAITNIMKKLMPGERIINEYHIGERLMLDVYCPNYKLAAEYHGRQHFDFVALFHESYDDFVRSKERDLRKLQLCKDQGITVVIFKYNDVLTEDIVYNRILDALRSTELATPCSKKPHKKSALSVKGNKFYEEIKKERREREKQLRKERREREKAKRMQDKDLFIEPDDI